MPSEQPEYPANHRGYPGYPPTVQASYQPKAQPDYPPTVQPGYPPSVQPGYLPSVQPGYPPSVQPGSPPTVQPGYPPAMQPGYPSPAGYPPSGYPSHGEAGYPAPPSYNPGYPPAHQSGPVAPTARYPPFAGDTPSQPAHQAYPLQVDCIFIFFHLTLQTFKKVEDFSSFLIFNLQQQRYLPTFYDNFLYEI